MSNDPPIAERPETTQSGYCENCRIVIDDLVFVWFEDEAVSECPECGEDIWIQAAECDVQDESDRINIWIARHLQ